MHLPGLCLQLLCLAVLGLTQVAHAGEAEQPQNATSNRSGKLFSVFQVIRFQNTACTGSGSKNGTCYTSSECLSKGGTSAGSCASGYGVCCTFSLKCGGTSSQNCTYFESTGSEIGQCTVSICKCNNNICQLRLDFNTFVITGPSTNTNTVGNRALGQPTTVVVAATKGTQQYSEATQCLTDTFTVTNPGGITPPVICGTNTGYHMYMDASSACNTLGFLLGPASSTYATTAIANRQWSIKVTQYSCDYNNLAPDGCTQYYYGAVSQCVYSYNYAGGAQLANQNQNICVRKERDYCRICWTAAAVIDFQVSGTQAGGIIAPSNCCQHGVLTGTAAKTPKLGSFDCVSIPGAEKVTGVVLPNQKYCGRSGGLTTIAGGKAGTSICSDNQPFNLRYLTDAFELAKEAIGTTLITPKGFKLCFIEDATSC